MAARLAGTLLALLALAGPALARPAPCPGGRFPMDIHPKGPVPLDVRLPPELVIAGDQVSIAPLCEPVRGSIRTSRRGTTVRATWAACANGRGARLRAVIGPSCWSVTGVLRARGFRPRFTAARVAACGNGMREGDEACDDGNAADGDCCSSACAVETSCSVVGCVSDADCAAGSYCARTEGRCDGAGVCTARPAACAPALGRVCGCDGRTYDDACAAAAAGVNVTACGDAQCGTIAGIPCPAGQWCDLMPGVCQGADLGGRCVVVTGYYCIALYDPVCGCDGRTYSNDCMRQIARVQRAHGGECGAPLIYH